VRGMRRATLILLCLAVGCGNLKSNGRTGDGGGPDSGSSSGSDSGAPPDSGSSEDGGPALFSWSSLGTPTTRPLKAVAGTGSGATLTLYLADDSPNLFQWPNSTPIFTEPNSARCVSLWASPDGGLYGAAAQDLLACRSNCTAQAAFTVATTALDFQGVCGRDDQHVYAVGDDNGSVGVFYQWNPDAGGWGQLYADTGTFYNTACFASSDGNVYIAAQGAVLRFDGQGLTTEAIHFPVGGQNVSFYAVGGSGSSVYLAGQGDQLYARGSDATWSLVLNIADGSNFYALPFAGPDAGLVAGYGPDAVLMAQGWVLDPHPPAIRVLAGWAASAQEFYLVGEDTGGSGIGELYRGTR
jgi:hypothetical protein